MATLAEHPVVAPSTFDQDIDTFLNLDQLAYTSSEPARPKAALAQPSVPTEFGASDLRSANFAATTQSPPIAYQGPSHQYDEHKQQTGLPPGALAQAMTFNNQMNGMNYGGASPGYMMNGEMFAGTQLKREDASLDFNAIPSRNPSEMDLESDNMGAVPGYFFSPNPNKSQYVDPSALGGQEVVPVGPSTQVGRMYPGMHQQQAAMAKAAQQKHHEMMRQQQMQQQQQRRMEEMQHNAAPQAQAPRNTNPIVEERISRLLQQMRQGSGMSSPSDSPSPSGLPQMAKAKKDEQDMDEDERLLASEEGKKLSSKERRQLRNKVSARAFRSRRKEYIGQLESEVAARTNEAHDLRMQNRALYEENARLTDLARMLLSSPNFSQFLDEMPMNGMSASGQTQSPQQQQPQQLQSQPQHQQAMAQPPMQSNVPKDAGHGHNAQEFAMQQNSQVGMVVVPNQGLDVATMGMNNGGWNSGIDMNYTNASVFAVLEVPEPPVLDAEFLSGKSSGLGDYLPEVSNPKSEVPVFERAPAVEEPKNANFGVENPDVEFDESDPAFALFADGPAPTHGEVSDAPFEGIGSEKSAFELVVECDSQAAVSRFSYFCHNMEAAFERISMVTSHLS